MNVTNNKITASGIATSLQTNTTLKTLCVGGETTTDEEALSLAAASTENTSIECLRLYWSSTHPESTLKEIGGCVRTSTLRTLEIITNMQTSDEEMLVEEKAKEWLQCVEVGGKELIQSLEDSHIQTLHLELYIDYGQNKSFRIAQLCQIDQSQQSLQATAAMVNAATSQKGLPDIWCTLQMNYYKVYQPVEYQYLMYFSL